MNVLSAAVYAVECRWLARAVSGAILFFVAAHVLAAGLPELADVSPVERALFFWFAMALVGFAALWRWEAPGALLSLVGGAGFYATEVAWGGGPPSGWVLPMFFTPGLLALCAWWFDHKRVGA